VANEKNLPDQDMIVFQSLAREDTNHTLSKIQIRRNNFKKWLQHEMHRLDSSGAAL
jgi:hypothetical protein